ncbi:MAG: VTT domain-containing protein [Coriobacteriia bacterium]|nr:VTT domain-containing protein [Coriobacteriia bacterium]MCL2751123.1 VTT domain-containing protein [Coriobacteriia bacterium]
MEVFFEQEALKAFIEGLGIWGPLVFFLLQVLQAIIAPIPGNLFTIVGGILFGLWPGFVLSYLGNLVGSLIGFTLVRKAGQPVLKKLIKPERFEKWMNIIGSDSANARTKILLILVVTLPFLPSDLMCLLVGLTKISYKAFIPIIIICRPWGQLAAALLGASSFALPLEVLIPVVIAVLAICVLAIRFAPQIEQFTFNTVNKMLSFFSKEKAS